MGLLYAGGAVGRDQLCAKGQQATQQRLQRGKKRKLDVPTDVAETDHQYRDGLVGSRGGHGDLEDGDEAP